MTARSWLSSASEAGGGAAPRIVAHRGASGTAPENTLVALERARAAGAQWVEVDVQRTADGVLILVHDDTWMRTAGVDSAIAATPWSAVQGFDVGRWRAAQFAGEPVPTLPAALALARSGLHFDLEIKSPEQHPGLASAVVAAVRQAGVEDRVVLSCFDAGVIEALAASVSDIALAYLSHAATPRRHARIRDYVLHHSAVTGDPVAMQALCSAGARVWAYTVDDPALARAVVAAGATAVISNYPERLLELWPSA
jgi:glycerophosphoryl diester phosphodiesterase